MNWVTRMRDAGLIPPSGGGRGWIDSVSVQGYLKLFVRDLDGRLVAYRVGQNIVTNGGRNSLSHLMAGDDVANKKITSMVFGSDSTPPTVEDTTLGSAVIITKATTFSFPAVRQVMFSATVAAGEGNGTGSQEYTEAGLLDGEGTLCSHKVFGLITKTSDLVITAQWTFIF